MADLYLLDTNDWRRDWPGLLALLPETEQREVGQLRCPDDRLRRTLGRGAARWILGRLVGVRPERLVLGRSPAGRPALAHGGPDFSISHSGRLVAVLVSAAGPVGVDVEEYPRGDDVLDLAQRFFAPAEAERLASLTGERRVAAFTRLWVGKEALLKARGVGLTEGLHQEELGEAWQPLSGALALWWDVPAKGYCLAAATLPQEPIHRQPRLQPLAMGRQTGGADRRHTGVIPAAPPFTAPETRADQNDSGGGGDRQRLTPGQPRGQRTAPRADACGTAGQSEPGVARP